MAVRRTNKRTGKKPRPPGSITVIFWLVFIIIVIFIFMVNAPTIQRNFSYFLTRITTPPEVRDLPLVPDEIAQDPPAVPQRPEPAIVQPAVEAPPVQTVAPSPAQETQQPIAPPTPVVTPQVTPPPAAAPVQQPAVPAEQVIQTRERIVYFTHITGDGQILHSRVGRRIPNSSTPMIDTLNLMLEGPTEHEINRGLLNLVPHNTRILSATVRGSTAYISFNEDFLFNTFGVEGYRAQLRQIVWTVTEFPNVRDVQFLIEGRRMDFLGEGIWIGSPISRLDF